MTPHARLLQPECAGCRPCRSRRFGWLTAAALTLMISLACSFGQSGSPASGEAVMIRLQLPTLTPTSPPESKPAAVTLAVEAVAPHPTEPALAPAVETPAADPAPFTSAVPAAAALAGEPAAVPTAAPVEAAVAPPTVPEPAVSSAPAEAVAPPAGSPLPPTSTPTPEPLPTPTPTPPPLSEGWLFSEVRRSPDPDGRDLLILGNLTNNTGSTQILDSIDGLFYDDQGRMINNAFYTFDYPVNEVAQGGQMPFEVRVQDRANAADFELEVLAEPGDDPPRQDFEFLEVKAGPQGGDYCVVGQVRNPGSELASYLVVAVVLYDGNDQVINYNYDDYTEVLPELAGDQTQAVTICVDPLQQEVARYELAAWGL